ncbi:MAG TPA: RHS repeat-associated core domain-containing protein [Ktedonobacterales bacterium]
MGNAASVQTTLPTGTDYQAFCYDEQNRLTWASSASGTVPCGGTWSAGSLAGATYTKTYSYDTLNRLTSGPEGSDTYGDPHHLDAATAITGSSTSYSASYDAAGDMTCRAPTTATTCSGLRITGAELTYDNERRLSSWQNTPSSPTSSTSNLYDGEGNRVEQTVTNGAATTTVTYIGELEELSTTAGVATTTTSYYAGGARIAQAVNGAFSYLGSDSLGSAQVSLDANGNAQASVLYDPYGNVRYSSGTMPGTYGFTGQRSDAATGLDYYIARYYDPVLGQFTSADSVQDGLNRYTYVGGNPTTATDPTGNRRDCSLDDCNAPSPTPTSPPTGGCTSDANCGCYTSCGSLPPPAPPPPSGTPTPPPAGSNGNGGGGNDTCTLSPAQCANGEKSREQDVLHTEMIIDGATFLTSLLGLFGDLWDLNKLLNNPTRDVLDVILDVFAAVGDILPAATSALSFISKLGVDISGATEIVGVLSSFVNVLSAPIEAFKAASGPWQAAAKFVLQAAWMTADGLLHGVDFTDAFVGIASTALQDINPAWNLKDLLLGGVHLIDGAVNYAQAYIAHLNGESIDQYCHDNPSSC